MIILAVDDEKIALERLIEKINEAVDDAQIYGFTSYAQVIEHTKKIDIVPDIAFLDIEMRGINGLEIASNLMNIYSDIKIIFTTGFDKYAIDAFKIKASGYLLKPVMTEDIKREVSYILSQKLSPKKKNCVNVRCFGNFEVFWNDETLAFSRSKAKEMFAYLILKQGTTCTIKELASVLFEDREYTKSTQNYMQKIISSMIFTFSQIGMKDIFIKKFNNIAVIPEKINCDYYRFLEKDKFFENSYMGEFMSQYSWAEFITGYIEKSSKNKI